MEQYSDMSQQLQDYSSLWEQDYLASVEMGMLSQGFSDSTEAENFFYGKNVSMNPDDNNHRNDAARNASSPETANPAASPGKPKRRRSKGAAAAQSTTFLNASISNFRALVQQHTGCHNANSSPKGPITLCFAAPAPSTHPHHHYYS